MAAAKRSVLSSLAVYAEDSDPESDSEAGPAGGEGAAGEKGGLVSVGYGEDDFTRLDGDEEGYEEEDEEASRQSEDDDSETEKPEAGDLKLALPEREIDHSIVGLQSCLTSFRAAGFSPARELFGR